MSSKNLNNSSQNAPAVKKGVSPDEFGFIKLEKKGFISSYVFKKNGLKVLYAHIKNSSTATTSIVYNVGSRHEETGDTGLAHMLEHMLFKPTKGKGVTWKDLENKGAHLNATTWLDRTLYYFTLPKEYLGDMLAVEADRMRNALFTDKEFGPERDNVLSEYEIQNSNPNEVLTWNMVATAYQNHGYHHDTIGWRGDIENYTTMQLKEFYDRHYWPNNATLIIAGDLDEGTILSEVEKSFGKIKQGEPPRDITLIEPRQEGLRRVVLKRKTPVRILNLAYKAPSFTHKDWLTLMVALNHLTVGELSPLYRALVETHLATNVSAAMYPTRDPFLLFFNVNVHNNTPYDTVENIFERTLQKEKRHLISEKKLSLLKESLLAEEAASRDGSRNIALSLSEYVATGNWHNYQNTFKDIRSITSADVQRVMNMYLNLDTATIGTIESPTKI